MPWTVEEKTFCVESYFETKSMVAVQARFKRNFRYADKKLMYRWVQKFRAHRTILNLNTKGNRTTYSGRPKSSRSQANIDAVRDSVGHSPRKSLRRRSQELAILRESIRRICTCTPIGYRLNINLLKGIRTCV